MYEVSCSFKNKDNPEILSGKVSLFLFVNGEDAAKEKDSLQSAINKANDIIKRCESGILTDINGTKLRNVFSCEGCQYFIPGKVKCCSIPEALFDIRYAVVESEYYEEGADIDESVSMRCICDDESVLLMRSFYHVLSL